MNLSRILRVIIAISVSFLFAIAHAAPNTGGDTNEDMKGVCELAGGTFTSTIEGNWACCWDDWGCAGCIQGVCTVKCHTERCRKANGQSAVIQPGQIKVKGFSHFGMEPVVPKVSTQPSGTIKQLKNKSNAVDKVQ